MALELSKGDYEIAKMYSLEMGYTYVEGE